MEPFDCLPLAKQQFFPYTPLTCLFAMAEIEPRSSIDLTTLPDTSPTARITDGTHAVDVTKQGDLFLVQISSHEQPIFSAALTPDHRVHIVFDAPQHATPAFTVDLAPHQPTPPAPQEAAKEQGIE